MRGVGLELRVGINRVIRFGAQLTVAAEQAVVIKPLPVCLLAALLIEQNERAGAVLVADLDASVLNEIGIEGADAQIDGAHCAGEFAEVLIILVLPRCDIHEVIIAAEQTAAHLNVRGVDRDQLIRLAVYEVLLILVIEHFDIRCFLVVERNRNRMRRIAARIFDRVRSAGADRDHIEHICAVICFKCAAVDIRQTAGVFAVVKVLRRRGIHMHLHNAVAGVLRGAVALVGAAVGDKGAVIADTDHGALDALCHAGFVIRRKQARDAGCQRKRTVNDAHDAFLVGRLLHDFIFSLGELCVGIVLCVFLVIGFVFGFLVLVLLFADGRFAVVLAAGAFLLVCFLRDGILILAVALNDGLGVALLVVVFTRIAVFGKCRLAERGFEHILICSGCGVQTRGIFCHIDAHLHSRADDGLQLAHREAALQLILLSARLEGAAVDHKIAVVDMEQIACRVELDIIFVGVDHVACKADAAGALPAPGRGVDDRQGRAVFDLNAGRKMRILDRVLVLVSLCVIHIAVIADLELVTVEVEHLVLGDDHRFPGGSAPV